MTIPRDMAVGFPVMDILGVHVHLVQNEQVLQTMEQWIARRSRCHFIVNTGFHGLHVALEDEQFKRIVNSADLFSPDGIATVWLARLLGKELRQRATSAELMALYFEKGKRTGYRSFFFGDTEETLEALESKLKERYPGHQIVGTYSPPFREHTEEEKRGMVEMINAAKPDVLWVGLGLPKQERWIYENLDKLEVPVAIGVGACFGFFSGRVKRVPRWIGEAGFEWAWRLLAEPRKLWRRDLIEGPRFLWLLARNWSRLKENNLVV